MTQQSSSSSSFVAEALVHQHLELHGSAQIATTGNAYEQDYVMVFEVRDGKISHYRESWNVLPAIEAFGGLAALGKLGLST